MSLGSEIWDATGKRFGAKVDQYNQLTVSVGQGEVPPVGEQSRFRYLQGLLGSTGLDSGTTDQSVDGSVTPQEFYVGAHADYDIHIMRCVQIYAATGVAHNNFGGISALSTGFDMIVTEAGEDTIIMNKATTGGEAIIQSGMFDNYGDGADTHELTNWTATTDAQTIIINFAALVPGGLRIGRGTQDRFKTVVNDDLTALTALEVRIYGYRHYP